MSVVVVLSTFPSSEKAAEIARVLVDERLAACVNLVPAVRSIYRWQGAIHDDVEVLAIMKTTAERAAALRDRLIALHPYDVPEAIVLPVTDGPAPYLAWLTGEVS
ncbi:MAG: divalent-cation tolerance protein CutA [Deltaproteobacteria bacterium]